MASEFVLVIIVKAPKFIILVLLFVSLSAQRIDAQWVKIRNNMFPKRGGSGAMCYCAGKLWVGVGDTLTMSPNLGKSWTKMVSPLGASTNIRDISFIDAENGLMSTTGQGILKTTDGGTTWTSILSGDGDFWSARFNGSTSVIHVIGNETIGLVHTSTDGGASWRKDSVGGFVGALGIGADHTVYVLAQKVAGTSVTRGWIVSSTDNGQSWKKASTLTDGDCYTLAVDSCDSRKLYLLNEDFAATMDNVSEIFRSSDAGESWAVIDSSAVPYFAGAMVTTTSAIFATRIAGGIVRSTDKGKTWTDIGGPQTDYDTRTIVALDNNLLFVLDFAGNLWQTKNSGGDSVGVIVTSDETTSFSSAKLVKDSLNIIVHLPIYFHGSSISSDVSLLMHYPTQSLTFQGARLLNGNRFDVRSLSWSGRAFLKLKAGDLIAMSDSLVGYADFLWTPFEGGCAQIDFDSIRTSDPCATVLTRRFSGIIGVTKLCGESTVRLPDTDESVSFAFAPNPAGEYGIVYSSTFEGAVNITVVDNAGRSVRSIHDRIGPGAPLRIDLGGLSGGVYYLQISAPGFERTVHFVHQGR